MKMLFLDFLKTFLGNAVIKETLNLKGMFQYNHFKSNRKLSEKCPIKTFKNIKILFCANFENIIIENTFF